MTPPPGRFLQAAAPRVGPLLLLVFLFAILGLASSRVHSFDIFWQLQSGRYMVEELSFIRTDLFTLAPDGHRFEHSWLHDLVFYGAYLGVGYAGLSLLKGLLISATAAALAVTARVRDASWVAILLLLPPTMLLPRGAWLERPQLWTFLGFGLFLLLLERHRRRGDRWIFLLVPVLVAWINLHAGSVLAAPLVGAYLAGEGVMRLLRRSELPPGGYRKLLLLAGLLALASLLTPYQAELLRTLVAAPGLGVSVDAAGQASGPITALYNMDWRATTFAGNPQFFYGLGIGCGIMLLGWRRLRLTDLLLIGGMAVMGLKLHRHTIFLFLALLGLLPAYLDAAAAPLLNRLGEQARRWLRVTGWSAALLLLAYFAKPVYQETGFFALGLRSWHYPVEAAEFVAEEQLPANLYNTYDWGGYLAWKLFPDYRVFWDGRQTSEAMFRYGLAVMKGDPEWQAILDNFEVNTIVSKACTVDTGQHYPVLDRLRGHPDWPLVFADESSLVFVRRSAVDGDWLAAHRLPGERIDATILQEASLLVRMEPRRYMAWWEMARVLIQRRQFDEAFRALQRHLAYAPEGRAVPAALQAYRNLLPYNRPGAAGE